MPPWEPRLWLCDLRGSLCDLGGWASALSRRLSELRLELCMFGERACELLLWLSEVRGLAEELGEWQSELRGRRCERKGRDSEGADVAGELRVEAPDLRVVSFELVMPPRELGGRAGEGSESEFCARLALLELPGWQSELPGWQSELPGWQSALQARASWNLFAPPPTVVIDGEYAPARASTDCRGLTRWPRSSCSRR